MTDLNTVVFEHAGVQQVFEKYPEHVRPRMMLLRQLILDVAAETEGVGEIEETLKWGEPSYLTPHTKSGSTIRIDWKERQADSYAMYFNCQTSLVSTFREIYSDQFIFEGNRCIMFNLEEEIPIDAVTHCISMALTYHLDKRTG